MTAISGSSPKPISQPKPQDAPGVNMKAEIKKESANIGAEVAKKLGGDAGAKISNDKYEPAKPMIDAKGPQGLVKGGCFFPPPQIDKMPGKLDLKGALLKGEASKAKENYEKTTDKATQDGRVTDKERRQINSAGRDMNIADKKVELHEAKQAHQKAMDAAMKDGNLTLAEQKSINAGQQKIDNLQKGLDKAVRNDKMQDFMDRLADSPFKPMPRPFPDIKLPDLKPGDRLPGGCWNPGGNLPGIRPMPLPHFPMPDLKPLPFPMPSLPSFPKPPVFDFNPKLFESLKF